MTRLCGLLVAVTVVLLLGACSAMQVRESGMTNAPLRAPEKRLLTGIRQYEDGDLKQAQESLQAALAGGLSYDVDKVAAHKYLAFILGASGRERECREQFAAALALDPKLELTRAEAGHPAWGPVFKSVKATVAPSR